MLRQETLVKAVCDYCRTPATAPRGDGDATLLFTNETEARELLGLNDDPEGWRELDNSLLICPPCARARDCVLGGGHHFDDWAPCGCEGWLDTHTIPEAVLSGVCVYELRICPQCHTTENRRGMNTSADEHAGGRDERS